MYMCKYGNRPMGGQRLVSTGSKSSKSQIQWDGGGGGGVMTNFQLLLLSLNLLKSQSPIMVGEEGGL